MLARAAARYAATMAPAGKSPKLGKGGGSRSSSSSSSSSRGSSSRSNRSSDGEDRISCLGRTMTRILRHQAPELNLRIRPDGYCKVKELLQLPMKTRAGVPLSSHTIEDVRLAVQRDDKQRFSLIEEEQEVLIRANQGHSIQGVCNEELLREITSAEQVPVCVHGTVKSNLPGILKEGLKRMQRNHVHFATGLPKEGGVISGMKKVSNCAIYLDVAKALQDGMKLYMSDNQVVLTEGFDGVVPCEYFLKVVDMKSNQELHLPLQA